MPRYEAPLTDIIAPAEDFTALFEIPQLELLQPTLFTLNSDWSEFLNFESDLSLFPSLPSLTPSLAGTPPLVDDATLSSSPPYSNPPSPDSPLEMLPYLSDKGIQLTTGEPIIGGQDFLLPPGENAGIASASVLLSVR